MEAKYRIVETASGGFRISQVDMAGNWNPICPDTFRSLDDAKDGLKRLLNVRAWYFDEAGNPVPLERDF